MQPEGIETSRQLDDGLGAATSGTGGSELEDVIIEERDPGTDSTGSSRTTTDKTTAPQFQDLHEFNPTSLPPPPLRPALVPVYPASALKPASRTFVLKRSYTIHLYCYLLLTSLSQGNRMVRQVHTDKNRRAPYFWSTSTDRIARPPALHVSCELAVGDVFVHEVVNHGLQVWVLDPACNGQAHWEPVYLLPNRRHPEDPTLFLSFPTPTGLNSKRAPTWVKESTAKRHKSHLPNILIDE